MSCVGTLVYGGLEAEPGDHRVDPHQQLGRRLSRARRRGLGGWRLGHSRAWRRQLGRAGPSIDWCYDQGHSLCMWGSWVVGPSLPLILGMVILSGCGGDEVTISREVVQVVGHQGGELKVVSTDVGHYHDLSLSSKVIKHGVKVLDKSSLWEAVSGTDMPSDGQVRRVVIASACDAFFDKNLEAQAISDHLSQNARTANVPEAVEYLNATIQLAKRIQQAANSSNSDDKASVAVLCYIADVGG